MKTKVRQHRNYLKQNEFLKRQAAKERQANEQKIKTTEIENNSFDSPARLPDTTAEDMEDSSSSAVRFYIFLWIFNVFVDLTNTRRRNKIILWRLQGIKLRV